MSLSEKKKASNAKWDKENTEQIKLKVPKGTKEILKQLSMLEDESMQRYIIRACYMRARACGADSSIYKGLPWCDGLEDSQDSTSEKDNNQATSGKLYPIGYRAEG